MVTKRLVALAGASAFLALSTALGSAASAASPYEVLDLEINEAPGSAVVQDSSGAGHDGQVGSHVALSGSSAFFDRHSPTEGIYYGADHLITIPDAADGSLDPGAGNFSVAIRYRTKEKFGNVIQKGQATTVGGQVKFQQPKGKMTCMFKTPAGTATAGSGTTPLNDNAWHLVVCDRTPTSVTMYVDGQRTGKVNHGTGTLDNKKPWTIGGKLDCDPASGAGADSCDYFSGDIDFVRMSRRLLGPDGTGGTTTGGDTTAPAVTSTSPAADSSGASRTGNVTATFSEPVKGTSGTTMVLRKASTNAQFGGVVTYDSATNTAVLDPNVTLPAGTTFNVTLSNSITDMAGNTLPRTTWSFTTGG